MEPSLTMEPIIFRMDIPGPKKVYYTDEKKLELAMYRVSTTMMAHKEWCELASGQAELVYKIFCPKNFDKLFANVDALEKLLPHNLQEAKIKAGILLNSIELVEMEGSFTNSVIPKVEERDKGLPEVLDMSFSDLSSIKDALKHLLVVINGVAPKKRSVNMDDQHLPSKKAKTTETSDE